MVIQLDGGRVEITLPRIDVTAVVECFRLLDDCSLLPAHLQPTVAAMESWMHATAQASVQPELSWSTSSHAPQLEDLSDGMPVRLPSPALLIDYSDNQVVSAFRVSECPTAPLEDNTSRSTSSSTASPTERGPTLRTTPGTSEPLQTPIHPNGGGECNRGPLPDQISHNMYSFHDDPCVSSSLGVDTVLAELAAAHWDSSTHDIKGWVAMIAKSLEHDQTSFHDETLSSLVFRCTRLTAKNVSVNFLWMMNLIQIGAKCQKLRLRKGTTSLVKIWRQELKNHPYKPELRTFTAWNSMGSKFAMLVGGGSVYLLILIAGLGLRTSISKMPADTSWQLANILRDPVNADHRHLVENFIAPTIARMKSILPISLDMLFSPAVLDDYQLPRREILCHDLQASDGFFDLIIFNSFNLSSRDMSIWCDVVEP